MLQVYHETLLMLSSMLKILITFVFVEVNSSAAVGECPTAKFHVDEAIFHCVDVSPILTLDPDKKLELDEQASMIFIFTLTSPKTILKVPTKSNVDSLHEIK